VETDDEERVFLKTVGGSYLSNIQQTGFQFNISYDSRAREQRGISGGPKASITLLTVRTSIG